MGTSDADSAGYGGFPADGQKRQGRISLSHGDGRIISGGISGLGDGFSGAVNGDWAGECVETAGGADGGDAGLLGNGNPAVAVYGNAGGIFHGDGGGPGDLNLLQSGQAFRSDGCAAGNDQISCPLGFLRVGVSSRGQGAGRHLGAACDADAAVPGGDGGPVGVYGAALEADVTCYLGVCGAVGLYRDDAFCAAVNGAGAWASDGDGPGGDALDAHVGGGVFRANGVFSHQVDGGLSRHKEVIRQRCRAQGERPVLVINIVVVCVGTLSGDGFAADQVIGIFLDFRPVVTADVQGFNGRVGVNSGPRGGSQQKAQHQGGAEGQQSSFHVVFSFCFKKCTFTNKRIEMEMGEKCLEKRDFFGYYKNGKGLFRQFVNVHLFKLSHGSGGCPCLRRRKKGLSFLGKLAIIKQSITLEGKE